MNAGEIGAEDFRRNQSGRDDLSGSVGFCVLTPKLAFGGVIFPLSRILLTGGDAFLLGNLPHLFDW